MWNWLWRRSSEKDLMIAALAALAALVRQLGGSVVLTMDELESSSEFRTEVVRNDNPEGMRIFVVPPSTSRRA